MYSIPEITTKYPMWTFIIGLLFLFLPIVSIVVVPLVSMTGMVLSLFLEKKKLKILFFILNFLLLPLINVMWMLLTLIGHM